MTIPNRFHFVFGLKPQTEPFHLIFYLCLRSCLEVNRPDSISFYYHYEPFGRYWELIKHAVDLVKVDLVESIRDYAYPRRSVRPYAYAHHSDFIRLEKLLESGGIYADLDSIFVNPIPPALYEDSFVLGREAEIWDESARRSTPTVCNAFIMSESDARFGRTWLDLMPTYFDGSWSRHSTVLPFELAQRFPDQVHLEPATTFYKHLWTREGLQTLLEGCDADYAGVVSMHLWAHLWWSRWRTDFSYFHAGRLTEDFVREVDTTYNLVARKYLPSPSRHAS